ncbi:MAG: crossover junction endodeoxyribonuclease RuvC [Oligoflexus sp.]
MHTQPERLRIIGIDPGSRITGFGILEIPRGAASLRTVQLIAVGTLRPKSTLSPSERTGYLHEGLYQIVAQYNPEICVLEKAFTGINPHSALRLGETRGALIAAIRRHGVSVAEVTPTHVKKTITGQGHATKEQIAAALKYLLAFERGDLPHDASDAVAIGLAYGLSLGFGNRSLSSRQNASV